MPLTEEQLKRVNAQLFPSSPKHDPTRHEMNHECRVAIEDWMSPLNKLIWFKAFHRKLTEVTIRDGRKFTLEYFTRPDNPRHSTGTGKGEKVVRINPEIGFAPCGTFLMREVTHPEWISNK